MRNRQIILTSAIALAFLIVVLRLSDIMILNHEHFLEKARLQQFKKEAVPVKRGIIMDRKGRELAVNLETESVYVDPAEVLSPDKVAHALSKAINKKPAAIHARLKENKRFVWIERRLSIEDAKKIRDLNLQGIGTVAETKRFYPKGGLASHLVGFVDSDNNGLEGVEGKYNKYLTARGEKISVARDAKGNVLSDGIDKEIKGNNIVLTIDEGLQYILEKNLDEAVLHWRAASATAIMMDPYSGEILAMANRPTFDPNKPSGVSAGQRRNRAITDCYEPGSTFKIIVGVAALEEGIVNPNMKFDCSAGYIEVGGKRIKDAHRHGVLTFKEVIQKSSNVGTIKIGLNLGKERLHDYIRRFGFADKTGIDLIGEVSGWVKPPDKWSGMSIGAISIGQEIAVTPLQVVRAYAAIANGGFLVRPYIVSEIISPEGEIVHKTFPEAKRIVSEKTVNVFSEILKTVTEEGGTATQASIEGNTVAGKTGTAQLIDPKTKRYSKEKYVSSFVGFVPADRPKMVMIVVIHEPKGAIYGGVVAAPAFKKIADEALSYLKIPRDDSKERGLLLVSN